MPNVREHPLSKPSVLKPVRTSDFILTHHSPCQSCLTHVPDHVSRGEREDAKMRRQFARENGDYEYYD